VTRFALPVNSITTLASRLCDDDEQMEPDCAVRIVEALGVAVRLLQCVLPVLIYEYLISVWVSGCKTRSTLCGFIGFSFEMNALTL
jgi:hypothetical protein